MADKEIKILEGRVIFSRTEKAHLPDGSGKKGDVTFLDIVSVNNEEEHFAISGAHRINISERIMGQYYKTSEFGNIIINYDIVDNLVKRNILYSRSIEEIE